MMRTYDAVLLLAAHYPYAPIADLGRMAGVSRERARFILAHAHIERPKAERLSEADLKRLAQQGAQVAPS